jgi:hypothetical protein
VSSLTVESFAGSGLSGLEKQSELIPYHAIYIERNACTTQFTREFDLPVRAWTIFDVHDGLEVGRALDIARNQSAHVLTAELADEEAKFENYVLPRSGPW